MELDQQVHQLQLVVDKLKREVKELQEKNKVTQYDLRTLQEWKLQKEGI